MEEARKAPNGMGMETSEIVATKSQKPQSQNSNLYDVEGIFNPHASKSYKKQRKKMGKCMLKFQFKPGMIIMTLQLTIIGNLLPHGFMIMRTLMTWIMMKVLKW